MQRLNVKQSQIKECIEQSLFAVPNSPHLLKPGEILLLQLVKADALALGKLRSRIEFALIYDHYEIDHTGDISRLHWPLAAKPWKYILFCTETIPTVPFSLEDLPLSTDYGGQANPRAINREDEEKIVPYIWGKRTGYEFRDTFGPKRVLETISNYDVIAKKQKLRKIVVPEHGQRQGVRP